MKNKNLPLKQEGSKKHKNELIHNVLVSLCGFVSSWQNYFLTYSKKYNVFNFFAKNTW